MIHGKFDTDISKVSIFLPAIRYVDIESIFRYFRYIEAALHYAIEDINGRRSFSRRSGITCRSVHEILLYYAPSKNT